MFQLAKVWIDQEPDIGAVELRYSCLAPGAPPGADDPPTHVVEMSLVPGSDPRLRRALLDLPREGAGPYLLRYRFHWRGGSGEGCSPVFVEEIVSADVAYEDPTGRLTDVAVLWSVEGWSAPNWSEAVPGSPGDRAGGPRRYLARVWGPRGASVAYVYQLRRRGSADPADDFTAWDNAEEYDYHLTLP